MSASTPIIASNSVNEELIPPLTISEFSCSNSDSKPSLVLSSEKKIGLLG